MWSRSRHVCPGEVDTAGHGLKDDAIVQAGESLVCCWITRPLIDHGIGVQAEANADFSTVQGIDALRASIVAGTSRCHPSAHSNWRQPAARPTEFITPCRARRCGRAIAEAARG